MALNFQDEKEEKRLTELHLKEAEDLAIILSQKYGIPYIDLTKFSINTDALRLIPEADAHAGGIACFKASGRNIAVALISPNNQKADDIISDLKGKNYIITLYLCSETSIARAWERYSEISLSRKAEAGIVNISDEDIDRFREELKTVEDVARAIAERSEAVEKSGASVSSILELMLGGALSTNSSDIHIEPQEESVRLRYRLDGVLHDISYFSHKIYHQLISRLKLVSGMRLNVKTAAQDGRFSIKAGGTEMEIRSSILPGGYGEAVVMRVLNPKMIAAEFDTLGLEPHLYQIINDEIAKPNGLILLTGPTGSGKTTTLYAFLKQVNDPGTKIITIEDPIEYHLKGVEQTQVNVKADYTFLTGLRTTLRQDPDIVMVGEIRDGETAKIAVNAALTGHLVFSTLHTNNAAGAIPRLIDLGVNPKILTSALTLPIAQRLIRKLCPICKKATLLKPEEQKLITDVLASITRKRPDLPLPNPVQYFTPVGCPACNNTGYKGRCGVFEAIHMDDAVAAVTLKNPSEKEIRLAAVPQGILDMLQDGIMKVGNGVTDLVELARVVDLHTEIIG